MRELNLRRLILLSTMAIFLAGCATVKTAQPPATPAASPEKVGVYHKIKKGQTLSRIARSYGVSLNDIISSNNIPNAARLEEDQLVFIPGATAVKEILDDKPSADNDFIWPIQGKIVHYFNDRGNKINKGIDIQGQEGDVVYASRSGKVVFADYLPGYGYSVIIKHDEGFHTVYSNNAKLLVTLGEIVPQKKPIANLGSQNDICQLHFEVRRRSQSENPLYYLP